MAQPQPLRVGIIGCGFWAQFQIAGWLQQSGVEIVGLFNRTRAKAEALSERFGGVPVFDTAEDLLTRSGLDVADVITSEETHREYVLLAAQHGVNVICQKPMASSLPDCREMVAACGQAGVRLMVHDNWRWQTPIRRFIEQLARGEIGRAFRAKILYAHDFPVFENQPFLAKLEHFMLMDMGTHILDCVRALFGEADSLYCRTAQVTPGIAGEDVATLLLQMRNGLHCTVCLSYASPMEQRCFPQTLIHVEGERGSLELAPDYWIRQTVGGVTTSFRVPPPVYPWADPQYLLSTTSVAPANAEFAACLCSGRPSETEGASYLETMRLVFAAYDSAERNTVVRMEEFAK
jgi:predicted dehydrogenase